MAKRGPPPRLATYRPIGSPLGRRNFGHWPHTTGCLSLAKRGAPLTAPPGRRAFADWPPTPTAPHWPEKGTGKATPHRPPTGHKGAALGGRPSHRPSLTKRGAPHWPPYRPSDAPPGPMATASLTGHLLATYWPSGEASHWPKGRPRLATGRGEPSPGPPPTGHLRPTWLSEAFGHLLPLPHTSR